MTFLSLRHTTAPTTGTLLTILVLLIGITTIAKGLKCYQCESFKDCNSTYRKLRADLDPNSTEKDFHYPLKIETCSSPKEQCQLFFSTIDTKSTHEFLWIARAGCATPPKNPPKGGLDGAGCFSTPTTNSTNPTNGTRTCYCKDKDTCNQNTLTCHHCTDEDTCDRTLHERTSFAYQGALECQIQWMDKWYRFRGGRAYYHHESRPRPPLCNSVKDHEWDKLEDCVCPTHLCNVMPKGLVIYLNKEVPRCEMCKIEIYRPYLIAYNITRYECNSQEYDLRCRPDTICSSHYIWKNETGRFTLNGLACEPPPTVDGKVIRYGWVPRNLSSTDTTRSFYCEKGYNCNNPSINCITCKGKECSGDPYHLKKTCGPLPFEYDTHWRLTLPWRTKECFVRYDDTVWPPELEAGCRDFTLDKGLARVDPICSLDLQEGWSELDKNSCRCEIHNECNPVLGKLVERIIEAENDKRPIPECYQCLIDDTSTSPSCKDYRNCRPGTVCSSHYNRKEEGVLALNGLGCHDPPRGEDGEVIRNGWYPPNLSSTDSKRSFYCDIGPNCNDPFLQCATCKGRNCKKLQLEYCTPYSDQWREELPGRTKECFISFDDSVTPPQLEAGCRDFTLDDKGLDEVDPICSRNLQEGWLRPEEKSSCRCDTNGCNQVLDKLMDRIPEEPKEPEEETDPDKGDPDKGDPADENEANEDIDDPTERNTYKPDRTDGGTSNIKSSAFMMIIVAFFVFFEIGW